MTTKLWVPDQQHVWELAEVVATTGDAITGDVTVAVHGDETTLARSRCSAWDPSHELDLDDLSAMNELHEAPLLHALRRRYMRDEIYTHRLAERESDPRSPRCTRTTPAFPALQR